MMLLVTIRVARIISPAAFVAFQACATVPSTPPQPPQFLINEAVPRIQPAQQTNETQRKGGVSITLAPTRFDTTSTLACSYGFARPSMLVLVPAGVTRETHERWAESRYNKVRVTPNDLSFLLTIRNGMNRVFRGAGALVQFNVDSRTQAVQQERYLEFINALIPPGGESQIRISGPELSSLRDGATLGVFLYDVVTAIDNAGNVSRKDNFEWFFRVSQEQIRGWATGTRRDVWVPRPLVRHIAEITPEGGRRLVGDGRCLTSLVAAP